MLIGQNGRELDALTRLFFQTTGLDENASRDLAREAQRVVDYVRGTGKSWLARMWERIGGLNQWGGEQ